MAIKKLIEDIEIPKGAEILIDGSVVKVKGEKGEICRNFNAQFVDIAVKGDKVILTALSKKLTRRNKRTIMTIKSHILNMINGVVSGYEYRLKICSGHFPISFSADANSISIKNFFGEKIPRKMDFKDVTVKVEGDVVIVSGIDKEVVGNVAARIEHVTRVKDRDRRVFQDGCYIIRKG